MVNRERCFFEFGKKYGWDLRLLNKIRTKRTFLKIYFYKLSIKLPNDRLVTQYI
jgi:hypothetical protein